MATKFKAKGENFQITSTNIEENTVTIKNIDKKTYTENVDFERVRKYVVRDNINNTKKSKKTKR